VILDLFAGPGGWSEGLRSLGLHDVGIEWDAAACATRAAAGHLTVRADVAQYPMERFAGRVEGLIASPPCQDFSLAGKQAGRSGEKGQLIDTVPVWVDALRPEWVACEQVPPALEVWEEFAVLFRSWGYSTWCGVLNAADYGVPQTRRRAYLLASRVGPALPPEPSHAKDPAPSLFGPERAPWVVMADALGWGLSERPSNTVVSRSLDGGSRARKMLATEQAVGRWVYERPATTVVGSFCPDATAAPGYRTEVSRQDAEGSVKVTLAEGLTLQGFRPDYPVQGSRTKQWEQVGNAVCPPVGAAVVAVLTSRTQRVAA